MASNRPIPLFWWSEIIFLFKKKENYGDLLSKYLVEKISGNDVSWVNPKKQAWYKRNKKHLVAIGSILPHVTRYSIVWGSGIIDKDRYIENADFRAVRGPETRKCLLELGYECPEIYGDPAILLPIYFNPTPKKKFKLGVIPHYNDLALAISIFGEMSDVLVIDLMTMDIEEVTEQIISCENTISSSLHGIIVSHAYRIPSLWVEFSDKIFGDGIKYHDYLASVKINNYTPLFVNSTITLKEIVNYFESKNTLPDPKVMAFLQSGLLASFPYQF